MTLIKSNIATEALDMLKMLMKLIMLMELIKLKKIMKLLVKLFLKMFDGAVHKTVWRGCQ